MAQGQDVRILDNLANGLVTNLDGLGDSVEFLQGDIRDLDRVREAVQGVRYVLHLAALGSVPRSIEDPATSNAVNADGTLNVLIAARDAGVRRLVYSSSSSVYGADPTLPKHEGLPTVPVSPYAVSKLAAENYTRVFSSIYGLETVCLRYFNVFGPRQRADAAYAAVIPQFMACARTGEALTVHGDGGQARDFTYVDNVVEANLLAAQADSASGGVFNVACGERYSLLDIIAALEEAVGHPLQRNHTEARAGDVRTSMAAVNRAASCLGYTVGVGFPEGLRRTWEAFCAQAQAGPDSA